MTITLHWTRALLLCSVMAAAGRAGADGCITDEVEKAMETCPAGASFKAGKSAGAAPAATVTLKVMQEVVEEPVDWTPPPVDAEQEEKKKKIAKVKLEILLKAIEATAKLVETMDDDDPKKPVALHQMAEKCFEIQKKYTFLARELDETLFKAKKTGDATLVQVVQSKQAKLEAKSEKFLAQAMAHSRALIDGFPDYDQREQVLFGLAFALDEMSRSHPDQADQWAAEAREVYKQLIKEYPGSPLVPHAFLSFAEYYFMEGKADSMGKALKFYREVARYPDSSVYAYALYKTAWCHYNMQEYGKTLSAFIDVIEHADQNPQDEGAAQLQAQARRELFMPFAKAKPPDHAWEFFERYGGPLAVQGMESLADAYFNQGFWKDATVVYHKLMAVAPQSDGLCTWQYMVAFASSSTGSKEDQLVELERLVSVYGTYVSGDHPQEEEDRCLADAREMIQNKAFGWHREAVGTDTQPGSNDKATMEKAIQAYDVLLSLHDLSGAHWDAVPQPGPEDTWTTPYDVAYYEAELAWSMDDWASCGEAFSRVVEMDPSGAYMQDAAYTSALCYTKLYHQHHASDTAKVASIEKKKLGALSLKMLEAFRLYACHVQESDDLPAIMYQMARVYYESGHYEEAAYWFGKVAREHVQSEVGPFAANLYLDSLNGVMMQDGDRTAACTDAIASAATQFVTQERYAAYLDDPGFSAAVFEVKCGADRKQAEALQAKKQWKEAALAYKEIYETWGGQCPDRLDEVLWNAAVTFQAANLLGQAIQWRKTLIAKFPASPLAKKAVYEVGANYHAIALYAQAADHYETFAKSFPGEPEAPLALAHAITFRLGLGEYDEALSDASTFVKNYSGKKKKPVEAAKVAFAVGQVHVKKKQWAEVVSHYRKLVKKYKAKGLVDLRIRAHVEIARAQEARGDPEEAHASWAAAAALFEKASLDAIKGAGSSPEQRESDRLERGGRMLDAGSEALFHLGEREYARFAAIAIPAFVPSKIKKIAYSDDPDQAEQQKLLYRYKELHASAEAWKDFRELMKFKTYSDTDLKKWADDKTEAMNAAAVYYTKALEQGVPGWVIASAARIGDMYAEFFDAIYNAPVPEAIKKDEEAWIEFVEERDRMALAIKAKAIEGYQECLLEATKHQWYSDWSSSCEQSLTKLDPAKYPISSEMKGEGSYAKEFVAWPGLATL